MKRQALDSLVEFITITNKVKATRRTDWVIRKLPIYEHIGDHCFSTALLSYLLGKKKGLDSDRCMAMALIHDIHEAITGDIATRHKESDQAVSNHRKKELEDRDTKKLLSYLKQKDRKPMLDLWNELKEGKTKEAQLVNQVDKLDYILELYAHAPYTKKQKSLAREFFLTAEPRIKDRDLRYIYAKVKEKVL